MNDRFYKTGRTAKAFSLAELLAALVIGAMVLVVALGIYNCTRRTIASVNRTVTQNSLPMEVLQRIAEDFDKIISTAIGTKVQIENKYDLNGFATARVEISKTYYDKKGGSQTFEKIVWLTAYDYDSDANGLVLYRSHDGVVIEDKLLDEVKDDWERKLYIPVCDGVTFFRVQAVNDDKISPAWNSSPPPAVKITLSFAEPFLDENSYWDVPEEEKFSRTIAVDRTRKIKFEIIEPPKDEEDYEQEPSEPAEPNETGT